jgi:predicted nucleotidyltransferase
MASFIKINFNAKDVILFGSYADGTPGSDSDIDLFIITETAKKSYEHAAAIQKGLNGVFGIKFPMDIIVRTPAQIAARPDDYFIKNILVEGVRL